MPRVSRSIMEPHWPLPDRAAWKIALEGDIFGPGDQGGAAKWRPATRLAVEIAYGRWLKWLDDRGELDRDATPTARATRTKIREYWEWLKTGSYADLSIVRWIHGLGAALKVMDASSEWRFVVRGAANLAGEAQRATNYAARREAPVEILQLGVSLMEDAVKASALGWTIASARDYRDGLLIALWICRPLRLKNLTNFDLGVELRQVAGEWQMAFPGVGMKAKRPFSCHWPKVLAPALELYLDVVRPRLLAAHADARAVTGVWTHGGGRLGAAAIQAIVRKRTKTAFGHALNVHLARHIVTSEIAERTPKNFTDIAAILAHASMAPGEKYYNLAGPTHAAVAYADLIGRCQREQVAKPRGLGLADGG